MPLPMHQPKEDLRKKSTYRTIAVAAGKGGVGKSTVAVNLAQALQVRGFKVGLLDADIYGPSIRRMLPEDRMPQQKGDTIVPALCRGVKMVSMAYFRKEHEAAAVRAPIANGIITQFLKQVDWGPLDYLIIDYPPGTGDIQLTLSQQASVTAALLVTTPQDVALMDVRKAAHLFHQVNIPLAGIVENMSYYLDASGSKQYLLGEGGGKRLAEELGIPLLEQIPIDPLISRYCDKGESLFAGIPVAARFLNLADQLHNILKDEKVVSLIKQVKQIDRCTMEITWSDDTATIMKLSDLQRACPCAGCNEKRPQVDEEVSAQQVTMVGCYALRIQFTSGCSHGIYEFAQLQQMAKAKI